MQGTTFENSFLKVTRSNGLSLGVYSKGSELRTTTEKCLKNWILFPTLYSNLFSH